MSISVIVPAYNEEKYLGETLESIHRAVDFLQKKDAVSTEVIVVDNGSTDSTSDIALSLGGKIVWPPGPFPPAFQECATVANKS